MNLGATITGTLNSMISGSVTVGIESTFRGRSISQGNILVGSSTGHPNSEIKGTGSFYTGGAKNVRIVVKGGSVYCNDGMTYPIPSSRNFGIVNR